MLSWDGPPGAADVDYVPRMREKLTAAALAGDHSHDWEWGKVRVEADGEHVQVEWVSRWTILKWGAVLFLVGTEAGALIALAINTWRHP